MKHEIEVFRKRFEVFAREVLAPAIWEQTEPARVEACCTPDRLTPADALGRAFEPVEPGWVWGPRWGRCWFQVSGTCPEGGHLRFSSGTEATIYVPSQSPVTEAWSPIRGLDVNRDAWRIADSCREGDSAAVLIEATCAHPWGVAAFEWDTDDVHARWASATPGRLERAEFAVRNETVWRLHRAYVFATQLLYELDPASQRAAELYDVLTHVTRGLSGVPIASHATEATEALSLILHQGTRPSSPIGLAIGHAHIDTAWLWTLGVTRDKVIRSWGNALELLENSEDFTMLASQAVQYAWLETDAPEMSARLDEAVAAQRWEPIGGMWVEPDASVPSGESLVRQMLRGTRYWRDRFGERGEQRVLFLPDTFGFPASLPNIMQHGGLDTFITNKMSWNQQNPMPMTNFWWRGLGEAAVLVHLTPGGDYNSSCTPKELIKAEQNIVGRERVLGESDLPFLQPFGFGDGGGGPNEECVEHVRLANSCEGLPQMVLGRLGEFCDQLHESADGLAAWQGELYLELHRGTTTTQGWLKRANLRLEEKARLAEWLVTVGPSAPSDEDLQEATRMLCGAWDEILLHQFHDILPGTSIAEVYDEARARLATAEAQLDELITTHAARWETELGPLHSIDTASNAFQTTTAASAAASVDAVVVEERTLRNGVLTVTLDECGRVESLRRAGLDRDAAELGPLNELVGYADRPMMWDAWDIDRYTMDTPIWLNNTPADRIESRQVSDARAELIVERAVGERSRITQTFVLEAGSDRLEVHTELDWHEDHVLLRAEHAVPATSERVTCGIQFGHVSRPTHENTSWDRMRFEWPAHRWVDLSEPGFGVALLTRGLYGHSAHHNTLGVSLARSPSNPDATADRGRHTFSYALMPHGGDWMAAGVDAQAERFNRPPTPLTREEQAAPHGQTAIGWQPFTMEATGPGRIEIAGCKPGEDDAKQIVLRLVETRGARTSLRISWALPVARVERVNGLEDPAGPDLAIEHGQSLLELKPFQIVALRLTRSD